MKRHSIAYAYIVLKTRVITDRSTHSDLRIFLTQVKGVYLTCEELSQNLIQDKNTTHPS